MQALGSWLLLLQGQPHLQDISVMTATLVIAARQSRASAT